MVPRIKAKVLSAFLLILLLLVPASCATNPVVKEAGLYKAPEGAELKSDLFSVLSVNIETYNQKFDEVPMLFKRLVGSEQIAGKIKLGNNEMLYVTFLMAGGKVLDFYSYDTPDDPYSKFEPSIIVETDEQTVRGILYSKDPLREAVNGMNEGTFNVEVKGVLRNVTLWTVRELYS